MRKIYIVKKIKFDIKIYSYILNRLKLQNKIITFK